MKLADQLHGAGINLFACIRLSALPADMRGVLSEPDQALHYDSLVLLGSGGTSLWTHLDQPIKSSDNPVDTYVRQNIESCFGDIPHKILYPGPHPIPLIALGKLAKWHRESPLGLGIHREFGLWSAYRAVILCHGVAAADEGTDFQHPCETCTDTPCISACPAGAVSTSGFDPVACSSFRVTPQSPCQKKCLARLACPVGQAHQYSEEQQAYHYSISLRTIKLGNTD